MSAFARFVMRDNGLGVYLNAQHIAQVRETAEGEPAIYLTGRDTPLMVEGTVEAVLRKLEAAARGEAVEIPEGPVAWDAQAVVAAEPLPPAAPEPAAPEPAALAGSVKTAKAKGSRKLAEKLSEAETMIEEATAESKPLKEETAKAEAKAPNPSVDPFEPEIAPLVSETEIAYPGAAWFMGTR